MAFLVAAAMAASVAVSRPSFDERLDPATLLDITISDPAQALTFARAPGPRLLLVRQYRGDRITAVDLTARFGADATDAIGLFRTLGYDALAQAAAAPETVTHDVGTLDLPFEPALHNIGIGANYLEHARESNIEEEPFVFPKRARPTRHVEAVARRDAGLLDYEAELGFVLLDEVRDGTAPARLGLVLCNEVTDRWALVRGYRRGEPMGTTGFADGKSRDGFAPIGPLLVIPRDLEAFYRGLELRLYLNGRLRQHERADSMVWGPRQILLEAFRRADGPFHYGDGTVPLIPGGTLAAGTVIFSGTPAGVIFKPLNLWNPWVYLRPGDEVVVRSDSLGVIRNRIVE